MCWSRTCDQYCYMTARHGQCPKSCGRTRCNWNVVSNKDDENRLQRHFEENEVLVKAGTQKGLTETIITRQIELFGNVMSKDGIEKFVTAWVIEKGTMDRGRQGIKYLDSLCYPQGGNYRTFDIIHATEDRWKWSSMITDAVNLQGTWKKKKNREPNCYKEPNLYHDNFYSPISCQIEARVLWQTV